MIGLMPQESRPVTKEKSATSVMAWRGVWGTLRQLLHGALHQWSGCDNVAADDDHHHLHGERDQRPKAFAALDGEVRGLFAGGYSDQEDDDDPDQREHQRIGKPAFAPIGKRDADAREAALLEGLTVQASPRDHLTTSKPSATRMKTLVTGERIRVMCPLPCRSSRNTRSPA